MRALLAGTASATAVLSLLAAPAATEPHADRSERPDTVVRIWGASVTASSGGRATVGFRIDPDPGVVGVRRVRGVLRFGPSFLELEGVVPGDVGGDLRVDDTRASTGVVGFELTATEERGPLGPGTLVEVTFRVGAPSGVTASVLLELDALEAAPGGADLLGLATVREGTVLVR